MGLEGEVAGLTDILGREKYARNGTFSEFYNARKRFSRINLVVLSLELGFTLKKKENFICICSKI
jgi:hypothetical protein